MLSNMDQIWRDSVAKDMVSFEKLSKRDWFEEWEKNRAPESSAQDAFALGLEVLYGRGPKTIAHTFFEAAVSLIDRMIREDLLDHGALQTHPLLRRSRALRCKSFAVALLGGTFDQEALLDAATRFVEWAVEDRWDDMSEDRYLEGVRLAMIAGKHEIASTWLNSRKRFRWYRKLAEILREMCRAGEPPITNAELLERFDKYYDGFRHPNYKHDCYTERATTRLELGLIRDKYFVSTTGDIDWDRAVSAIAQ